MTRKTPAYSTTHQRLSRQRGPATHNACDDCGAPAAQWAYDHADPAEVWEVVLAPLRVLPYSLDPLHYRPLCLSCHARADQSRRVACKYAGHEFTPENTYVRPSDGQRECRTCKREAMRRLRRTRRLAALNGKDSTDAA